MELNVEWWINTGKCAHINFRFTALSPKQGENQKLNLWPGVVMWLWLKAYPSHFPQNCSRKHPFMFSLPTVSLMDSFPFANRHLHLSFFFTCHLYQCDYCLRGTENTLIDLLGGDIFAHVNRKSGVRAATQTIISNCFLFSISRSIVLTPFSDILSPNPWCQGGCIRPALHAPRFKFKRNSKFTPTIKPKLWVWLSDE